ncbi:MAG: hypothetical protein ABJC36_10245, partial [Gemmatimonadales bacterium]
MMLRPALGIAALAALAMAAGAAVRVAPSGAAPAAGYSAAAAAGRDVAAAPADTLPARLANARPGARPTRTMLGSLVVGYFSARGLPPLQGALTVTDTGLVFHSADGRLTRTLPVVGPVRVSAEGRWRASAVSLAYVDAALGRDFYVFRVDGGVFETDAPGPLMDVAAHPSWLDSLGSREWTVERALVDDRNGEAVRALLDALTASPYADSLYAVLGRPERPVGTVGARGRAAGRLGEYVASRDSLALDPARMGSEAQLRYTLAHELAHRWQARSAAQLAALWQGIPTIRDPRRYGYDNVIEHQAEAAAFAVHFLLATATARDPE